MTDVQIEIVTFVNPAVDGALTITHADLAGITPKGALFFWSNGSEAAQFDDQPDAIFGMGAATAVADQWAWSVLTEDGVSPSDTLRMLYDANCIVVPSRDGVEASAPQVLGAFEAFVDGGVRLDFTMQGGISPVPDMAFTVVLFAGDSDMLCQAGTHLMNAASLVITTGFRPDAVFSCPSTITSKDQHGPNQRGGLGWQDFRTNPVEVGMDTRHDDLSNPSDPLTYRQTGEIGGEISAAGAPILSLRYDTPTSTGITARHGITPTADWAGYFAVQARGMEVKAGNIDSPVATGNWQVTDPGFEPIFVALLMNMLEEMDTVSTGDVAFGVGLFTPDDQAAQVCAIEDNADPGAARSAVDIQPVCLVDPTGVDLFEGAFVSMDDEGWTIDMADVDTPAKQWGYLAIGLEITPADAAQPAGCVTSPWTD